MTTERSERTGPDHRAGLRRSLTLIRFLPVVSGVLLGLSLVGCTVTNDSLWPSITPTPKASGGHATREKQSSSNARALAASSAPLNVWDVAGGTALLISSGGVLALLWRLLAMNRRFDNLRSTYETLASRRDKGASDVIELSLKVSALNQQIQSLQGEIASRPGPPAVATGIPPAAAPAAVTPPLQPAPQPPPAAANGVMTAAAGDAAQPATRPRLERPDPAGAGSDSGYSGNGRAPAPASRNGGVARSAGPPAEPALRPAAPPPPPAPVLPPPDLNQSTELATAAVQTPGLTLTDLVDAINGEARRPVQGISFVELDFADPPDETLLRPGLPPPTRLRRVSGSGLFLLVMFDGDDWLFPAVATLQAADPELSRRGLFELRKGDVDRPKLKIPAQMREVGGLWEVTDSGQILIPA